MQFQREHQSSAWSPKNSPRQQTSQFASRPFAIQPQQEPGKPPTQEQIENEAFEQQKFEATGLEIKQKSGSITPQEQKRLGVLQAKMDGLLAQRVERASRFGHNFANIAVNSPDSSELAPIQAKLTIGQPGDKYEQEADAVASQVVSQINQPQSQTIQREEMVEEEDRLQMQPQISTIQREAMPTEEEELQMKPMVQRLSDGDEMAASPDLEASIQQAKGSGQPLSDTIREPMEQVFGADFSGVRVHADAKSDELNQSIQAKAFTTGTDIFFRQGAYDPESRGGQELIAHELTHVVQQSGGMVHRQERGEGLVRVEQNPVSQCDSMEGRMQRAGEDDQKTFQQRLAFWQQIDSQSREIDDQPFGNTRQSQTSHRQNNQFKQLKYWRELEKQNQPQGNASQSQTSYRQNNQFKQLEYWRELERQNQPQGNASQSQTIVSDSIVPDSETGSDTKLDGIHPVVPKTDQLKSINQLKGGVNGEVFLFEYDNGQKIVIKFEEEYEPKDAIIGTQILKEVGANTPNIRQADSTDLEKIIDGLEELQQRTKEFSRTATAFLNARNTHGDERCLVMDFAQGQTAWKMMTEKPADFIKALQDKQFQKNLGKILAADAFAGNPDRAMAHANSSQKIVAWFNPNNLLINPAQEGFSAVAIDNTFKGSGVAINNTDLWRENPEKILRTPMLPYGEFPDRKNRSNFISSVAAANETYFKEEVRVIFDHIVATFEKIYVQSSQDRDRAMLDINALQGKKDEFVENVAKSAKETMTHLLKRGQNRKEKLQEAGANDNDIEAFRERKRYIRLIEGNVDPKEAYDIARSQEEYRFWVLTEQLKLSEKEANEVLKQGDEAYKQKVKELNK